MMAKDIKSLKLEQYCNIWFNNWKKRLGNKGNKRKSGLTLKEQEKLQLCGLYVYILCGAYLRLWHVKSWVKPQSHYSDNQSPTSRSRQPSATISNQFPTKILVLNRSPTVCRPVAEWSTTNCQLLADWLSNILHILELDQQPFGE